MSQHEWAATTVTVDGQRWAVSRDAVTDGNERVSVTYLDAVRLADEHGGQLPTPAILDARWQAADLKNQPHTQRLWEGEDDPSLHSYQVDCDVAEYAALTGAPPDIVGNCGKHWTGQRPDGVCELYGWHVEPEYVRFRNGRYWGHGLPVHSSESDETDSYIVQRSRDSSHNDRHSDYSMTLILCRKAQRDAEPPPDSEPEPAPRVTSMGENGAAVRAWQAFVGATVDSWHGRITEALTVKWLAEHPETKREASQPPDTIPGPPPSELTEPIDDFIPARNYTLAKRALSDIRAVVMHSTENKIAPGVARNVALWFGGAQAPRASAHYCVGPDETIGCVGLDHTAWAAPGCNVDGVQVELVGQAFKTVWLGDGLEVLQRGAELVAWLCDRLSLPIRRVTAEGLARGERGITTHDAVTQAYCKSTHVDPGGPDDKRWPWDEFLRMVEAAAGGGE